MLLCVSFYVNYKSRARVIWPIMLVPIHKNGWDPVSIADLSEAKEGDCK